MLIKRECRAVSRLLWDYARQQLCERDSDRVVIHISRCGKCRGELQGYQMAAGLVHTYKQEPEPESKATWHALRAQLEYIQKTEAPAPAPRPGRGTVLPVWAGTIAAGALLAAVWTAFQPADPDSETYELLNKGGINTPILSEPDVAVSPVARQSAESIETPASVGARLQAVGFRPETPRADAGVTDAHPREELPGVEPSMPAARSIGKSDRPTSRGTADKPVKEKKDEEPDSASAIREPQREFVMGSIPTGGSRTTPVSDPGAESTDEHPVW